MSGNQSYGGGQGQGGTFGRSQGFNPQSLGGMPGMNNAMQRFAPQYGSAPQGFNAPPMNMVPQSVQGNWNPTAMPDPMGQQSPQSQRYGVPAAPPPPMPMLQTGPTPQQLAAHMAQRNNITNGYVEPGAKPTPQQLAAHMAANAAYTTGYGTPGAAPLPPWLK